MTHTHTLWSFFQVCGGNLFIFFFLLEGSSCFGMVFYSFLLLSPFPIFLLAQIL